MYREKTREIQVNGGAPFIDEGIGPSGRKQFFWAYRIEITNNRGRPGAACSRYWKITDSPAAGSKRSTAPAVVGKCSPT